MIKSKVKPELKPPKKKLTDKQKERLRYLRKMRKELSHEDYCKMTIGMRKPKYSYEEYREIVNARIRRRYKIDEKFREEYKRKKKIWYYNNLEKVKQYRDKSRGKNKVFESKKCSNCIHFPNTCQNGSFNSNNCLFFAKKEQ